MSLNNLILLSQIAGYVVAFILSLCIVVPMTLHQDEFRGHCLLFSKGEWLENTGQFSVNWSSQAYCNYTIFVGVVLALVSGIQIYRMAVYIYQGTDSNFLSAFVDVVGCFCLCGMSVVAAIIITSGFIVWCNNMTMRFPSCDMASGQDIDKQDGIDTSNFYIELGTAQETATATAATVAAVVSAAVSVVNRSTKNIECWLKIYDYGLYFDSYILRVASFGAWASMACWVGLSVFALLKMCQQHQIRNMRASMFRERQRLINEGGVLPSGKPEPEPQPQPSNPVGPEKY